MRDLDIWHVEYLQVIQHFIINYWNDYGRLPCSLRAALEDALKKLHRNPTPQQIALFQIPRDPGTGVSYEYRITGDNSFELCANVDQAIRAMSILDTPLYLTNQRDNRRHKAVHVCFSCSVIENGD
jgi:hypothetical protein